MGLDHESHMATRADFAKGPRAFRLATAARYRHNAARARRIETGRRSRAKLKADQAKRYAEIQARRA